MVLSQWGLEGERVGSMMQVQPRQKAHCTRHRRGFGCPGVVVEAEQPDGVGVAQAVLQRTFCARQEH